MISLFCCGSPMTEPPRIAVGQLRQNTRKKAAKDPTQSACSGSDPLHRAKIRRSRLRDLLILLWLNADRTPANCRRAIAQEHAQERAKDPTQSAYACLAEHRDAVFIKTSKRPAVTYYSRTYFWGTDLIFVFTVKRVEIFCFL
ncbi:MAG: hypothetical protein IKD02_05435 [Clostridia bacterium]|nr:hypothetical protein [Clostridia bacterium]